MVPPRSCTARTQRVVTNPRRGSRRRYRDRTDGSDSSASDTVSACPGARPASGGKRPVISPASAPAPELDEPERVGAERLDQHHLRRDRRMPAGSADAPALMCSGRRPNVSARPACRAHSATRARRHRQVDAARQVQRAAAFADAARQEVHRRRAGEAGDELRRRTVVDAVRRVVLDRGCPPAARRCGRRASSPRPGRA